MWPSRWENRKGRREEGGRKRGREEEREGGREGRKERVQTTKFIMKPALIYDSFKKNMVKTCMTEDRTHVNQM